MMEKFVKENTQKLDFVKVMNAEVSSENTFIFNQLYLTLIISIYFWMILMLQVHEDPLARKDHQDIQDVMEIQDCQDILETMAHKENQERKVQ